MVLGCVGGPWMCRWFLDASLVLGCVGGFCLNLTQIKMCQENSFENF